MTTPSEVRNLRNKQIRIKDLLVGCPSCDAKDIETFNNINTHPKSSIKLRRGFISVLANKDEDQRKEIANYLMECNSNGSKDLHYKLYDDVKTAATGAIPLMPDLKTGPPKRSQVAKTNIQVDSSESQEATNDEKNNIALEIKNQTNNIMNAIDKPVAEIVNEQPVPQNKTIPKEDVPVKVEAKKEQDVANKIEEITVSKLEPVLNKFIEDFTEKLKLLGNMQPTPLATPSTVPSGLAVEIASSQPQTYTGICGGQVVAGSAPAGIIEPVPPRRFFRTPTRIRL